MMEKKSCGCDKASDTKKNVNKGISCDVNNCYYHDGRCYCTAERITVGPSNAASSADTLCATFKNKDE